MSMAPADAARLITANQQQAVATLASAIIAASGRPWSIEEAMAVYHDVYYAMHPNPSLGAYQAWATTKDERLKKVHK